MNSTQHQYQQQYKPQNKQHGKGSGCGLWIAIGCVGLLLLVAAITGGAFWWAKSMVSTYTDNTPSDMPVVNATDADAEALRLRMSTFTDALKTGQPVEPLMLSAQDINTLIAKNPEATNMPFKVYVSINEDKILGEASIPLGEIPMLSGRWLNGSVVFSVQMASQRLMVFIESMTVKGRPVDEKFMQGFRQKNLMENAGSNPEFQKALERLESIEVRDGMIVVTPKQSK